MLTIDKLRADIAALAGIAPEEIGDDDNLIDLGLDSMRLLTLLMQLQEAGVDLEFAELAEHFTLSAFWGAIEAKKAAGPARAG